jgi:HPt (histidine-containing phosphotransfer) domain-containing protein
MKDINLLKSNGVDVDGAIEILGDLEMYNETLNDFLDVSLERMPKLEKYKEEKDMKNYAIEVHAMKSDSKYLGFTKLADMALEHQIKSEENDIEYVSAHYEELINEANEKISLVKAYLN